MIPLVTRRDERGIALPMALGVMLVLTISLIAVIEMTAGSARTASRDREKQRAVAIAEAGIHEAAAKVAQSTDPSSPGALSAGTVALEGGSAAYSGTVNGRIWTLTATATVNNPAGGSALTQTVSAKLDANPSPPIAGNEAWNYVFSDAAGCTTLQNSVTIAAPLYTKGNLCIQNQVAILGPRADIYGGIQLLDMARVGTSPSDAADPAVRTRLGCRNGATGGFNLSCPTGTYRVYRSSYSNSPPLLTKPPFDSAKRTTARPGPSYPCTTSAGTVPSFTSTGAIDLMPPASYTCQVWQGSSIAGELSWNNATKVLTVSGTTWFDGDLLINNAQQATYVGRGTIYFAGTATIRNQAWICAMANCVTSGWDPNTRLLTIVSGSTSVPGFVVRDQAKFQGAAYSAGGFQLLDQAIVHGPVVASVVDVRNNGFPAGWSSLLTATPGAPGNSGTPSVTFVPGTWSG